MLQPGAEHAGEAFPIQAVVAAPALPANLDQPGLLEHAQVPGGGRPEAVGYSAAKSDISGT